MKSLKVDCLGSGLSITIETPKTCPHCGETMSPEILTKGVSKDSKYDTFIKFGVLAKCNWSNCNKFYALEYSYNTKSHVSKLITYKYRPPIKVDLPENIECVSPSFVEIFTQATKAEEEGLTQISGVGYRKSLEFLIKDYVIFFSPTDKESVEKSLLGNVIKKYLSHIPRIQSLAKAATWIGNDETHYVRRHDDKDIRDMKQFIKSTAHFVVADYDADIAEKFISGDN